MMFQFRRYLPSGIASRLLIMIAGILIANVAMAAGSAISITSISTNVTGAVKHVSDMLEDVALICGIGFILASFFKFHQHKLNPTQVPMSQGVTLLVIGAALSVFPHLLNVATMGVFGTTVAKLGSGGIGSIIKSS